MIASAERLSRLIERKERMPSVQLEQLVAHVSRAPLSTDLLEADSMVWGSFWHFDVIAPGYTLPASELALLRATRLDHTWPEGTTVERFLHDLQQTVIHPKAGIWLLKVAGQPCAVFAAATEQSGLITVVWYCISTDRLHAGYRTVPDRLILPDAVEQRPPNFPNSSASDQMKIDHGWLDDLADQNPGSEMCSLTAQLDAEILRIRATTATQLLSDE